MGEKKVERRVSGASGAALGENGQSRAHHALDRGFRNASEMFGEYALVSKCSCLVPPVNAQEPTAMGLFSLCRRDFADGNFQKGLEARVAYVNMFGANEKCPAKHHRVAQLNT